MTIEGIKNIIDFILDKEKAKPFIDCSKVPFVILEFMGGEPLLKIDIINEAMNYWKTQAIKINHIWGYNYMVNFTTNGILLHHPGVMQLINDNYGKVSIGVTIDGTKELHDSCRVDINGVGSYDRVIKNVDLWKSLYTYPGTKLTLAPENLEYLSESVIDLFNKGIDVNANPVFENVWGESDHLIYYHQLIKLADIIINEEYYLDHFCSLFSDLLGGAVDGDQNWCGGDGKAMLAIDSNGIFYPCVRYMGYSMSNSNRKPISCGNLKDGWDLTNNAMQELRQITLSSQSTEECIKCKIGAGCAWCSGYNYDVFGTPNKRATFICKMHKVRVLANEYYYNRLANVLDLDELRLNVNLTKDEKGLILND